MDGIEILAFPVVGTLVVALLAAIIVILFLFLFRKPTTKNMGRFQITFGTSGVQLIIEKLEERQPLPPHTRSELLGLSSNEVWGT